MYQRYVHCFTLRNCLLYPVASRMMAQSSTDSPHVTTGYAFPQLEQKMESDIAMLKRLSTSLHRYREPSRVPTLNIVKAPNKPPSRFSVLNNSKGREEIIKSIALLILTVSTVVYVIFIRACEDSLIDYTDLQPKRQVFPVSSSQHAVSRIRIDVPPRPCLPPFVAPSSTKVADDSPVSSKRILLKESDKEQCKHPSLKEETFMRVRRRLEGALNNFALSIVVFVERYHTLRRQQTLERAQEIIADNGFYLVDSIQLKEF